MNTLNLLKSFKIQIFLILPIFLVLIYYTEFLLIFLIWIFQALFFLNPSVLRKNEVKNEGDDSNEI
jgi:hypothetical protein